MRLIFIWIGLAASVLAQPGLKLETLEGDGAVYNLRSRAFSRPRVRVSGVDGRPAPGATVTFRLPDAGPGAVFADGKIATVSADVNGEAAVPAMKLNSQLGAWEIRMAAVHSGMTARASIQQINAAPIEAMAAAGKRSRSLYWLAAVAAGAAAAAAVGLASSNPTARSGGVSAPGATVAPAAQPLTISLGAGTVGAP